MKKWIDDHNEELRHCCVLALAVIAFAAIIWAGMK